MAYSKYNKEDYLRYYKKEQKAGRKPLTFSRWLGGSSSKPKSKSSYAQAAKTYENLRTKGTVSALKAQGISEDEMPSDVKRRKKK